MIIKAYAAFVDNTPKHSTIRRTEKAVESIYRLERDWLSGHALKNYPDDPDIRPVWISIEPPKESEDHGT